MSKAIRSDDGMIIIQSDDGMIIIQDPIIFEWKNLLIACVCAIVFIILLSLDAWKALKRQARWLPGQALVLSALTIQLLTFIDNWDSNSLKEIKEMEQDLYCEDSYSKFIKDIEIYFFLQNQLLIDSRRVMICVLVAYVLPGMARQGLGIRTVWGDIGALELSVIIHMAREIYFFREIKGEHIASHNKRWLIPSHIALFIAITLLVVLLSCTVIATKSIRSIMAQKVPLALSHCCNSPENLKCKKIEDHVLKSWIVVRASQPDYIMARSVFSAFAGLIVTFCVVLLLVKWRYVPPHRIARQTTHAFQFAFVVAGSILVLLRWLTAVFYLPKDLRCFFYLEDFWTRSLIELKDDLSGHLTKKLFLSLLLTMALWLQKLMVLLSKACWFLSEIVFIIIRPLVMSPQKNMSGQFSKYKEALEIVRMPGETAYSLWRANESAFIKIENHMRKGENGTCEYAKLFHLIGLKTGPTEDEVSPSFEEERHFKQVGKKSWKMRAVSLLHFMIYYYDGTNSDVVDDCIEACSQAWDFMDIVDSLDPEAELVSLAAEKEFRTLENIWKKHREMHSYKNSKHSDREERESNSLQNQEAKSMRLLKPLRDSIDQLSTEEGEGGKADHRNPCIDKLHDSQDWKTLATKISLQKTWNVIVLHVNEANAIHHLQRLLANLIDDCIENKLEKALRENCNKWAADGKEEEIFNAAFIAGKATRVWKKIDENAHTQHV